MDIGSIGPVIVAAAAAGGLIFAVMKWPSERESLSAATHRDVIATQGQLAAALRRSCGGGCKGKTGARGEAGADGKDGQPSRSPTFAEVVRAARVA